jgi:hypothetical protein
MTERRGGEQVVMGVSFHAAEQLTAARETEHTRARLFFDQNARREWCLCGIWVLLYVPIKRAAPLESEGWRAYRALLFSAQAEVSNL